LFDGVFRSTFFISILLVSYVERVAINIISSKESKKLFKDWDEVLWGESMIEMTSGFY